MAEELFGTDDRKTRLQDEVDRRIQALKQNPDALLERFDRNGDGVIDAHEWEIVRQVVASEVVDEQDTHEPGEEESREPGPRLSPEAQLAGEERPEVLDDRFEVLAELGRGAHGQTHLAHDRQTDDYVAIKELDVARVEEWKIVELFERESRVLEKLDHPGIPSFVDAFHVEEDDVTRLFLAQEFIEGENLKVRLAKGELFDERRVVNIAERLLEILEYLHGFEPPILHRDIKPSNLIERPDGSLALVDFGAVQTVMRGEDELGSTVVGTSGYMPPEQLMGRAVPATDLYAVGGTMIHLLTRRHPSDLPAERMNLQWRSFADVGTALADVVDRLAEPVVEDRFESAVRARVALRQLDARDAGEAAARSATASSAELELEPVENSSSLTSAVETTTAMKPVHGKPRNSNIEMWRKPGELEIHRPMKEGSGHAAILAGGVLVIAGVLLLMLQNTTFPGVIFVVGGVVAGIFQFFQRTSHVRATFDTRGVEAHVTRIGRTKRVRIPLHKIQPPRVRHTRNGSHVTIRSHSKRIPFVVSGNRDEAEWVANAIQAFLIEMENDR